MNTVSFLITSTFALISLAGSVVAAPAIQELTAENYREWMEHVRPSDKETQWRQISWRNKLMPAVAEARKLNRPVLLWAMNGNPCGET